MTLQPSRPIYSQPSHSPNGMGEGCHPFVSAFWGALALMFIPPFVSGLAEGAKSAWRERK